MVGMCYSSDHALVRVMTKWKCMLPDYSFSETGGHPCPIDFVQFPQPYLEAEYSVLFTMACAILLEFHLLFIGFSCMQEGDECCVSVLALVVKVQRTCVCWVRNSSLGIGNVLNNLLVCTEGKAPHCDNHIRSHFDCTRKSTGIKCWYGSLQSHLFSGCL